MKKKQLIGKSWKVHNTQSKYERVWNFLKSKFSKLLGLDKL